MHRVRCAATAAALIAAAALATAGPAAARTHRAFAFGRSDAGAVFAQSDALTGNTVTVYDRGRDGTLTAAATYPTGGNGGQLAGSMVDHLASQNSLVYDAELAPAVRGQRWQQHASASSRSTATGCTCCRSFPLAAASRSASPSTETSCTCSTRSTAAASRATGSCSTGWYRSRAPSARSGSIRRRRLSSRTPPAMSRSHPTDGACS